MNNLGFMYQHGRGGLPKDEAQAVIWYRKAADLGDPASMNNLGYIYLNGWGHLPKNDELAVGWFRNAAEAGNPAGMTNLRYMYDEGREYRVMVRKPLNGIAKRQS